MPKEYNWVINNSDKEYRETCKGKEYVIPPFGKVKMTRRERVDLLSQFTGCTMDQRGVDDECAKPLKWEVAEEVVIEEKNVPTCMVCGAQFENEKELKEHSKKHEGMPAAIVPDS